MMRWMGIAVCLGGLLILSAVNATERRDSRNTSAKHQVSSTERTKQLRRTSASKLQKSAHNRKNPKAANRKMAKHKAARHAKAQRARLSVFDAGKLHSNGGGNYRLGAPYVIGGQAYTPQNDPNYRVEGKASWYGRSFHGRRTANGETFDMDALTAAHPTLPLPSYVRVTNLENHRSIIVRLNDRGPFRGRRLIDVSVRAAKLLGFYDQGLAQVRVEYISRAELGGSNNDTLAATLRNETPAAAEVGMAPPIKPDAPAPLPNVRSPMLSMASLRLKVYDPDIPTDGRIRWY